MIEVETVTIRESTWELAQGAHRASSGQACLLEVASLKAGEEFSDRPVAVSVVLAAFGRALWDSTPPDQSLADLVAFADRLIGTAGRPDLDAEAGLMAADWVVRRVPGVWLRLAGLDEHADALSELPELTSWTSVNSAQTIASSAAEAAASSAARSAAWAAAEAAARGALAPTANRQRSEAVTLFDRMISLWET